jgi:fatty-acid peroxygenase
MSHLPSDPNPDSTLALLSQGYTYISKRCKHFQSDVFRTRLMFYPAVCMLGEEAARIFYEPDRFTRKRAMPPTALMLLQGLGSVQVMDGEAHRWRKRMFMSIMTPERIRELDDLTADQWRIHIEKWQGMDQVALLPEAQDILFQAVARWAGVPLGGEEDARQWTRAFAAMVDGAGAVGPRNWRGMMFRARAERWITGIIEDVRAGRIKVPKGSALEVIASHRDQNGEPLAPGVAAVELINILRPTVAIAWYVTFAALALHDYPECRRTLAAGDDGDLERFVQEVRRFYPFFPAVGGRVQRAFDWRGHHFAEGEWVLLDLYGTNHDPRIWDEPQTFRPDRFRHWNGSPFSLIPQGAGEFDHGHRCAGEWITIALMKTAVRMLTTGMSYEVPEQDLGISLSRMPAQPKSRFLIRNVRRAATSGTWSELSPHREGPLRRNVL